MTVDALASEIHYIDHIAPVWHALNEETKGTFKVTRAELIEYAALHDIKAKVKPPAKRNHTIVASWGDYRKTTGPVIYMEHGIGHTYSNQHPSYAGAPGRVRTTLFLNQHHLTDEKNKTTYPNAAHAIIGVPRLDTITPRPAEGRTVAISFHWECRVSPESRSAFEHYRHGLRQLRNQNYQLVGHAHPHRGWPEKLKGYYQRHGIPYIPTFNQVLEQADVYVIDNSSTGYEFAAAGRNVIHMNAPWYRKYINHGIRFWDYLPGPMVDDYKELISTIHDVLDNPDKYETQRQAVVNELFPHLGNSAQVAAQAIEAHL